MSWVNKLQSRGLWDSYLAARNARPTWKLGFQINLREWRHRHPETEKMVTWEELPQQERTDRIKQDHR